MLRHIYLSAAAISWAATLGVQAQQNKTGTPHGVPISTGSRSAVSMATVDGIGSVLLVQQIKMGAKQQNGSTAYIPVSIELHNISSKGITAFECNVVVHYSDGTERASVAGNDFVKTVDRARRYSAKPGATVDPKWTFGPGGHRTIQSSPTVLSNGAEPTFVEATPILVVFEDLTAVGDRARTQALAARRSADAQETEALITDISAIVAAPNRASALAGRLAELAKSGPPGSRYAVRAQLLRGYATMIQMGPDALGHDPITSQLTELRAEQQAFAQGAHIKEAK